MAYKLNKKYRYDYKTINLEGSDATIIVERTRPIRPMGNKTTNFYSNKDDYALRIEKQNEYRPPKVVSISLCNTHSTDSLSIDLYAYYTIINQSNDPSRGQRDENNTLDVIDDTYETYYLLNNVVIPSGATLILDMEKDLCYDDVNADLYAQLGHSSSKVDIIIKKL